MGWLIAYEILDLSLDACMSLGLGWAIRVSTNLDINYHLISSDGGTMAAHHNIYLDIDNWEHLKTSRNSVTLLCTNNED